MPKYDFECKTCGNKKEIYMNTTQFDELICECCGGRMKRQFPTSVSFQIRWVKPKVKEKMKKMGVWGNV